MKKSALVIAIVCGLSLPALFSCQKWLEATSSSKVTDSKLFSTRSGFHEALNGVYLAMASENAMGRERVLINDVSCGPFAVANESLYRAWQQHTYNLSAANSAVTSLWLNHYKAVANINKALAELENRRDVVSDELEYNLIKGELLAARALIHFDLMRMYGHTDWGGDNASKLAVPYVTVYGGEPTRQLSYAETQQLLLADISQALECLKEDPVRGLENEAFESAVNGDGYWTNRQIHLNYYAVEALAARVNLFLGNYVEAARLAEDVAQSALSHGLVSWLDAEAMVKQPDVSMRDMSFSCEHLFSLDITSLSQTMLIFFPSIALNTALFYSETAMQEHFVSDQLTGRNDLYEDVRGPACLLKYTASGYQIQKFYASTQSPYKDRFPIIRLSEMYYIMAEAAVLSFDFGKAASYLDTVRSHRGITTSLSSWINMNDSADNVRKELLAAILEEYLREQMGEGQYIFTLKRFAARYEQEIVEKANKGTAVAIYPISNLILPYPQTEITEGRIQDL